MKRLVIYPKDIATITGKCERSARLLLCDIKISLNKKENQFITFKEFSQYTGINLEDIYTSLKH